MANLLNQLADKVWLAMQRAEAGFVRLARTGSKSVPIEYFILANLRFEGVVVAFIDGQPIRQIAIDENGARYQYAGIAPRDSEGRFDVACLRSGEWFVQPGLIYTICKAPEEGNTQR
jgi:hypothetical protein